MGIVLNPVEWVARHVDNRTLRYASDVGAEWQIERIAFDSGGAGGCAGSVTAGDCGGMHVAHKIDADEEVRVARRTSSATIRLMRVTPCRETIALSLGPPGGGRVHAAVFDLLGRRAQTLSEGELASGQHTLMWDGRDRTGRALASGTCICLGESDGWRSSVPLVAVG